MTLQMFLDWLKTYGYIVGYIIFILIYSLFVLVAFYHAREYGYAGDASKVVIFSFITISIVVVVLTFIFLLSF